MGCDELRELVAGGLIDIGSHTVSHSNLASLPDELQRREIRESKARLEEVLGSPVTLFSYPFGFPGSHYTPATVQMVRDAGFECAFSGFLGNVRKGADKFQIPRAWPGDWDGDTFARHLRGWFLR